MPSYDFKCLKCDLLMEDLQLSIHTDLTAIKCEKCGELMQNLSFGGVGSIFKGAGFSSKNLKVREQKKYSVAKLKKRQRDQHAQMRLIPNVEGIECDSFKEAAKIAKDKGLDPTKYQEHAKTEKKIGRYEKPY